MLYFVRTFSILRMVKAKELLLNQRSSKLWKKFILQKHCSNWLVEGMHPRLTPPHSAGGFKLYCDFKHACGDGSLSALDIFRLYQ